MRKRFQRSDLNKFLGKQPAAREVTTNHVFGKIAKDSPTMPRARSTPLAGSKMVAGYRDSMVGSTIQYRDKVPTPPSRQEAASNTSVNEGIVGNRPRSGTTKDKKNASGHHFVEPPKRPFHRFD